MGSLARNIAIRQYEGYIQIVKIEKGKTINLGNFKFDNLNKIESFKNDVNVFYTPNTNYNGKRGVGNLKNLRALYIDFDIHSRKLTVDDINYIIAETWLLADRGTIPRPTKAIVTGRGVHIYWELEPSSYGALATWQELEDYLYNNLKHLGADKKATDAARLMRLEGTINPNTNTTCYMYVFEEKNIYSMYDLRDQYLDWRNRHNKNSVRKNNNSNIINFFNSYSLHISRAEDIVTLVNIRNGQVVGYRNFILHCYAYWKGIYIRNHEELKELVFELNNKFNVPLKENEVNAILKCIPKAINKFLEYEQGIRSGQVKRVSSNMRDKGGYWYKNETLIDRLDITIEEQEQLKTIIGTRVKYNRNNKRRNNKRRNNNGLTKREQNKEELINKIKYLKKMGLKQIEIAKELKINKSTVSKYLKL